MIDAIKAYTSILFVIAGSGMLGYWAVTTLSKPELIAHEQQDGVYAQQKMVEQKSVVPVTSGIEPLEALPVVTDTQLQPVAAPLPTSTSQTTVATTYSDLIANLQTLKDKTIYMKAGDKGANVGTIQDFFIIYTKSTKKPDNDFGATTKNDVMAFQKASGLGVDGQTGPATYQKMIDYLKKL